MWIILIFKIVCVLCSLFNRNYGLCTYPSDLRGTWDDSVYGKVDFSDSSMNMQTQSFLTGISSTNFTCQINSGDLYISKSVRSVTLSGLIGGIDVNVWICMELKSLTNSSFYYYVKSSDQNNLNFGEVVPVATTATASESDVCNTSPTIGEFHMLVNSASPSLGLSTCVTPLLGNFTYTMNFGTSTTECGSSAFWDGCSDKSAISLNNTGCGSQFVGYSASGSLGCVVAIQDTTTPTVYYQGAYNFDASVNGASTKRFTCLTVEAFTSYTNVSQSPDKCSVGTNASVLPTNGALLQLTTIVSCAPVTIDDPLTIAEILAIVFSLMVVTFIIIVIGICYYRDYKYTHQPKIVIIPKQLPRGAHTVVTLSDTTTMVNKEIITEPKLVVKPIRNGQPQSVELQQWKHNAEFQEPEGQLTIVKKTQTPVGHIDTMKSRVATQMREETERKRNMAFAIDRVRTNLEREFRVISALKAKDAANREVHAREATASKRSQNTTLAPPKSRMSQYIHDPQAKGRMSTRTNKVKNGMLNTEHRDHSLDDSYPRTSTPVSVQRPASIDMIMSEANLSLFSVDLKYRNSRASNTPKPQPDITVTKKLRNNKKFPAIKELTLTPGEFQNFER